MSKKEKEIETKEVEEEKTEKVAEKLENVTDEQEKAEKNNEKKKSKKGIVIAIIIVIIILAIAGAIGYYFLFVKESDEEEEKKTVGTEWGDEYYAYLIDELSNENSEFFLNGVEETDVSFIDIDGYENPAMIFEYSQDDTDYIGYLNIVKDDNGTTYYTNSYSNSTIEYLYNISEESYNWYVHTDNVDKNSDTYILMKYNTDEKMEEVTEIEIEKDSKTTQETVDGEELTLSEYDETFVKVEADRGENVTIDLSNFNEDNVMEALTTATGNYKTDEELQTEDVVSSVEEAVEAVNTKKQEMEDAKKEVEEKQAQHEEEIKLTSSNLQSKVGTQLKYVAFLYLGPVYGFGQICDVEYSESQTSKNGLETYELSGISSISGLESNVTKYMSSSIAKKIFKAGYNGTYPSDMESYLSESGGKLYLILGGIGDGDSIDTSKAKLVSSENGVSKVTLKVHNDLEDKDTDTLTITITYDEDSEKYMVTDFSD